MNAFIIATLIFFGILLMLVELLLIPGVGVAGALSLGSFAAACWYAFTYIGNGAGILVTIICICLLAALLVYALRAKTWKRFETKTVIDAKVNEESGKLNPGDKGITTTRLAPMGSARFENTTCEVKSDDNSMINSGVEVEVVRIEDNKVFVKPLNQ